MTPRLTHFRYIPRHFIAYFQRNEMQEEKSPCFRSYHVSLLLRRCIPQFAMSLLLLILILFIWARGHTESLRHLVQPSLPPCSSCLYRCAPVRSGWTELLLFNDLSVGGSFLSLLFTPCSFLASSRFSLASFPMEMYLYALTASCI